MDWDHVVIGKRARVRLPSGLDTGKVVEVAGRILGRATPPGSYVRIGNVDPGWARLQLEDGSEVLVHQDNIIEMIDE